ncbi:MULTISPECIES: MFS transporter [unclassified Rhizobium]|uniref:MFS transporter n=1 Tax=unclassified Rhizobium TaxID=2613769 RepID=UPI0011A855CE|nr:MULTISPECIES: MFS transporter [unclassified Rhizobium]
MQFREEEPILLDSAISKARRHLLPILMICYFAAFLDRVNVGFAALEMNKDLALTGAQFGIGAGAFFITYVLCEIPSNILMTKFGARVWVARILLTWGVISGLTAFIWDAHSFYVARLLLGAAEAGFFPGMIYFLTQWFPRTHRARMTATVQTAVPISTIIGAPLSVLIITSFEGWLQLKGWQWLFIIESLPAIVMAFVVFFLLPSNPDEARWLSANEKAALNAALEADKNAQEQVERFDVKKALLDKRVLLMCVIGLGNVVGTTAIALWMPQVVKSLGATTTQSGLLTAVPAIAGLVALLVCGWNADRTRERIWHVAGPYIFAACGLAVAAMASSPVFVMVGLIMAAAGITGASPSVWAIPSILLTGTASAAAIALINSVGSVGGFFGPTLIGWLYDRTGAFAAPLLMVAGVLLAAAFVAVLVGTMMRENLRIAQGEADRKLRSGAPLENR